MAKNQKMNKFTRGQPRPTPKNNGTALAIQIRRKAESTNLQLQELCKPHVDAVGQRSICDLPAWVAEAIFEHHPRAKEMLSLRVSQEMLQLPDERLRAILWNHPSALQVVSQLLETTSDEQLQALVPNIGDRMLALCPEDQAALPSDAEVKKLRDELQKAQAKIAEQQDKLQKANDKIAEQERTITELRHRNVKADAMKDEIEKLEDQLSEYEAKYNAFGTNDLSMALAEVKSQSRAPGSDDEDYQDMLQQARDMADAGRDQRRQEDAEDFKRAAARQRKIEAAPPVPGKTETCNGVTVYDVIRHTPTKLTGLVIGFTPKGYPRVVVYKKDDKTTHWANYELNPQGLSKEEVMWFKAEKTKRNIMSRQKG